MTIGKIPLHGFRPPNKGSLPFELIKIEDTPEIAFLPKPNRHTFYEVFWVTEGSGKHVIDFVEHDVRPNSLFFVGRGQVHYWKVKKKLKGVVLLFEADLFQVIRGENFLAQLELFNAISRSNALYLDHFKSEWVNLIIQDIEKEFSDQLFGYSQSITALLQLLLIRSQRLAIGLNSEQTKLSAGEDLTFRYLKLIEKNAKSFHKVGHFAEQLGVTVSHLSTSVKDIMGIAAGDLLRRQLILEAKRELAHTNLSIAEIAYQLNFSDASYFGRFFKREEGITPKEFRGNFPLKYQNPRSN